MFQKPIGVAPSVPAQPEAGAVRPTSSPAIPSAPAKSEPAAIDAFKRKAMDTSLAFVKLRELERESEASRAVYESFRGRAREMHEQERLDTASVRVLSDAQPPQDRAWPPRRLIMLLGALFAGALGGIGLAYVVELMRGNQPPAARPLRKAA
jgi:hypothetical protein